MKEPSLLPREGDNAAGLPALSIITVVRNDLVGLKATLASTAPLISDQVERVVVDGSDNSQIREYLSLPTITSAVTWISEPDRGIYDAMNKGLALAKGRFALFLNAGDTLRPEFVGHWAWLVDWFRSETCVLVGHAVESFRQHHWLHPGVGNENSVFAAPQHQATFYPRDFYRMNAYRVDRPISADGEYTVLAFSQVGGAYLPVVVSEFSLGGVSSNYSSWKRLRRRLNEHRYDSRMKRKLRIKFLMWWLLPRSWFYGVLAVAARYTKVAPGSRVDLRRIDIRRAAECFIKSEGV